MFEFVKNWFRRRDHGLKELGYTEVDKGRWVLVEQVMGKATVVSRVSLVGPPFADVMVYDPPVTDRPMSYYWYGASRPFRLVMTVLYTNSADLESRRTKIIERLLTDSN